MEQVLINHSALAVGLLATCGGVAGLKAGVEALGLVAFASIILLSAWWLLEYARQRQRFGSFFFNPTLVVPSVTGQLKSINRPKPVDRADRDDDK
jgi:hypothetical protein